MFLVNFNQTLCLVVVGLRGTHINHGLHQRVALITKKIKQQIRRMGRCGHGPVATGR